MPGVQAVITAADLPDALVGRRLRDMPVLARDVVRFVGEKVAAVAAETEEAAEEALLLIDVEYEELEAVFRRPRGHGGRRADAAHGDVRVRGAATARVGHQQRVCAHHLGPGRRGAGVRGSRPGLRAHVQRPADAPGLHRTARLRGRRRGVRAGAGLDQQQRSLRPAGTTGRGLGNGRRAHRAAPVQHRRRLRRQGFVHGRAAVLLPVAALRGVRSRW